MRWGVALFVFTVLAGCATKYQDMGFTGGVSAEPVMTDVYRIVARGNGYTSSDRVQDFVLLKAAETTLAAGGSYFVIVNDADRTNVSVGQTPGTVQTNVIGHSAFTTYSPGTTYNVVKPGEALIIRVVRLNLGQAPPAGAWPAQDIANTIGPRVKAQS
ncbi:MAG: CC0125/CC1285 family lipoprotein [Xanthobacteraceae bacterium]